MTLPTPEVFERAGLRAWPGVEVEWDGSWVRRASNGYTQRANSVQSLDPRDDADVPTRLAGARAWLKARGLPAVFRVTPLAGAGVVAQLDAEGWERVDDSHLFAMELGPLEADPRGVLYGPLDPRFLATQQKLRAYSDDKLAKLVTVLKMLDVPACGVVLHSAEGAPVASAIMAVADGIVVTGNVVTDSGQRRKGFAAAMMRTGLAWARETGASMAALNVAADNTAGQALYASLGYRRLYDYTYRVWVPRG